MSNKALIFASLLSVVMLSGCGGKMPFTQNAPDFDSSYSITAEINCGKLETVAEVTREGKSDWVFSFTSPDNLAGLKFTVEDGKYTASLGSLNVTAEDNSIYSIIPEIIATAVDSLSEIDNSAISSSEGILTIDTEFEGKKVTITAKNDGTLVSLKCPYHKLAVAFKDNKSLGNSTASSTTEE